MKVPDNARYIMRNCLINFTAEGRPRYEYIFYDADWQNIGKGTTTANIAVELANLHELEAVAPMDVYRNTQGAM